MSRCAAIRRYKPFFIIAHERVYSNNAFVLTADPRQDFSPRVSPKSTPSLLMPPAPQPIEMTSFVTVYHVAGKVPLRGIVFTSFER